jgi:hypothetical protein
VKGEKMLYKISKKNAGIGIILTNSLIIAIELLVILKILPFDIIGGGRAESYQAACAIAITSIIIIVIETMVILLASGLIKCKRFKTAIKVFLWVNFIMLCFNIVGNLFGITLFEKVFMTLICLINIVFVLRLAMDKG